jgi:hypothetical protein
LKTKKVLLPAQSTTRIKKKTKPKRSDAVDDGDEKPFSLPAHKISVGADEEME